LEYSAARKSNAINQIAKQINQISRNLISNKQIQNPGFEITFDIFDNVVDKRVSQTSK
jgi:hypothetical protein